MAEYSIEQIAKKLGITRERVRMIEASALKKLRHPLLKRKLLALMGDKDFVEQRDTLEKYGDKPCSYVQEGKESINDTTHKTVIHRDD